MVAYYTSAGHLLHLSPYFCSSTNYFIYCRSSGQIEISSELFHCFYTDLDSILDKDAFLASELN